VAVKLDEWRCANTMVRFRTKILHRHLLFSVDWIAVFWVGESDRWKSAELKVELKFSIILPSLERPSGPAPQAKPVTHQLPVWMRWRGRQMLRGGGLLFHLVMLHQNTEAKQFWHCGFCGGVCPRSLVCCHRQLSAHSLLATGSQPQICFCGYPSEFAVGCCRNAS
jgi:hypothetical protein